MRDIRNLETRTIINEKDIATINKQLEKISANQTQLGFCGLLLVR
ncbi:hypothetical protein [Bacillus wiedmannii]